MLSDELKIKYIGGPTVMLQIDGLTFLTDPTFDPKGTDYATGLYTLHKTQSPSIILDKLGKIDFVLLTHDHHFDNLDNAGRSLLPNTKRVYTTVQGAARLGNNAVGLETWQTVEIPLTDNRILCITGTPCRHGPVDGDRGPVTGFVLNFKSESCGAVYITGDTVWYDGVIQVSQRFNISLVLLFMGAAIVPEVGGSHLTMTAAEGIKVAETFEEATIVPLHYEGWQHFTESRKEIQSTFGKAGLIERVKWAELF